MTNTDCDAAIRKESAMRSARSIARPGRASLLLASLLTLFSCVPAADTLTSLSENGQSGRDQAEGESGEEGISPPALLFRQAHAYRPDEYVRALRETGLLAAKREEWKSYRGPGRAGILPAGK